MSQTVCLDVGTEIKAQHIRVLDVFLIGPLMVWGGKALQDQGHAVAGPALMLMGVSTVLYNGRNYMRVREKLRGR